MGGETPYVDYAIIALVVIIFGVLVGFSFKVWRVMHALMVIAVFISSGFFVVFAAAVLKTDTTWHKIEEDYARQVTQQEKQLQELLVGLPGTEPAEVESRENSQRYINQLVSRVMIGRGLVWRGMLRGAVGVTGDDYVSVELNATFWGDNACVAPGQQAPVVQPEAVPTEEPSVEGEEAPAEGEAPAADPTAVRRHGLEPGMLVFAYQEQPATNVGVADLSNLCRLPQVYLGQFRVVESTADSARIDLVSVLPREEMLPSMLQVIEQNGQGISWSLYQTLPTDRHDIYASMTEDQLRQLLPATSVGEFIGHLQPVPEGNENSANPIPPQNIWARVRFTKPHTIQVDTPALAEDAPPPAAMEGGGPRKDFRYFDEQGLAIFPELRQSGDGTIAFEPGAEIVVPTFAAEALVSEGVAEEVERVYVRPLRQYQTLMAGIRVSRRRDQDKIAVLEVDNQRQALANTQAGEQVESRKGLISELETDIAGFQIEVDAVTGLKSQLDVDFQNLREDYRRLYLNVKARAAELTRIHAEIMRRIESGEEPGPAEQPTDLASAEAGN